jgi:hypothetical protein
MSIELVIHDCLRLRVVRFNPKNNNALTLEVVRRTADPIPFVLFGMDAMEADEVLLGLGDEDTQVVGQDSAAA